MIPRNELKTESKDQGLQRQQPVRLWVREYAHDRGENVFDAQSGLGGSGNDISHDCN